MEESCKWTRVANLVWKTECDHQVGTPRTWEPIPGMACMCCKKPVEVVNDGQIEESVRAQ